jgi:ubiquinone/menaquinone biosynthesis C-methylase UbiE
MDRTAHRDRILDQFSRQAVPFSEVPAHSNEAALRLMLDQSQVQASEDVLDVGCGPGIVACAFARRARRVTATDLTPAMLARARELAVRERVENIQLEIADMERLPFADDSFSVVVTRYTFHHLLEPVAALREMIRVCRPGGRVMVVDVAIPPEHGAAYDEAEKIRDSSHVHALSAPELEGLFGDPRLEPVQISSYRLEMELAQLLAASFPEAGGAERLAEIFERELVANRLGLDARRQADGIRYFIPCAVLSAVKRSPGQ